MTDKTIGIVTDKTIGQILHRIQKELKAPKGNKNTFGNYSYRSAEDILEAVKKCLHEGEVVHISDEIVLIGERYYVKAEASLSYGALEDAVFSTAYAREEETKKGMDAAQITGSASSYARKYALNGLFAIDDTKDADATNDHGKGPQGQDDRTEKWTAEDRSLQAEVITKINQCETIEDVDNVLDEHAQKIYNLPTALFEAVDMQIANHREFLAKGGKPTVKSHRFVSVDDQRNWVKRMLPVVKGFKSSKALADWKAYNLAFIMGLSDKGTKENPIAPRVFFLGELDKRANELETPIG